MLYSMRGHEQERLVRGKMTTRYEIDGWPVTATIVNAGYPRFYAVRIGGGPVLGYLQRSALSRSIEAYLGSAEPDTMGAQPLGSYITMRAGMERIVREALARNEAAEACRTASS